MKRKFIKWLNQRDEYDAVSNLDAIQVMCFGVGLFTLLAYIVTRC